MLVCDLFSIDVYVTAISDLTRLTEGEAALLTCIAYGTPYVEITWTFNNETVTNSSQVLITSVEYLLEDGEMIMASTLQICDAGVTNSGEYTCIASAGPLSNNATTQLLLSGKHLSNTEFKRDVIPSN